MSWLFTTHPDRPVIDVLRGCAGWAGVLVLALVLIVGVLMVTGRGWRPVQVRWLLAGITFADIYMTAREFHEMGRPFFPLGLPIALISDACVAVYLAVSIVKMRRGDL